MAAVRTHSDNVMMMGSERTMVHPTWSLEMISKILDIVFLRGQADKLEISSSTANPHI